MNAVAYDLSRLASYVRFYQTVSNQIEAAWQNLERLHGAAREALEPFREPLAPVASPALASALGDPPIFREALGELWQPTDPKDLSDLDDIYEVAGRFSFQGEDNANLRRIQALVAGARNEIVAQKNRLADLQMLPAQARATASRLAADEEARAAAERAEKTAAFGPLAETVGTRAKQTLDAVRAVPFPDLSSADTAAEEYRKYAVKLDQVYQTCLPFLRKAISNLYGFVGCEPTASWPDALPITPTLPAELCTVPPAGSKELTEARAQLTALGEEELSLGRAREALGTAAARVEGEMAAAQMKDAEIGQEIGVSAMIIDYMAAAEGAEAAREQIHALTGQAAQRVEATGKVLQSQRQTEAAMKLLEEELRRRWEEIGAREQQLAAERKDEPVLFGKDEWRSKVAALEGQLEALKGAYGQGLGSLNQLKIDFSSLSVQVQTEQAQQHLLERQLGEARERLSALEGTLRELGVKLGASRPARAVPVDEARKALASLQQAKLSVAQRMDQLKAEMRRQKEEAVRILGRMKQIAAERQHVTAMVQSAEVDATQGREAALSRLAQERRAVVERHVSEVLGTLEKSLSLVGPVFVDPARDVLMKATEPRAEVSAKVLEAAGAVAPVVEKLARELMPELLSQDATLGQIQREFCDVAPSACQTAWGG
jgi:hypothetical protein